jgi:SAM-dependent methyltransferase
MFCHGELVKRKPDPKHLTSFYLMVAMGGAAGGVFVGLIAPKAFPAYFELPIGLSLCVLLLFFVNYRRWWVTDVTNILLAVFVLFGSGYSIFRLYEETRFVGRNFYGCLSVKEHNKGRWDEYRVLLHGAVLHGAQFVNPQGQDRALAYYDPGSGAGQALRQLRASPAKVGVIGLGAGTLAIYARPGDLYRFYEINPLVEDLARREFFYLSKSSGKVEVVLGDGRISLEHEPDQHYDLLVVDAFSGESIPAHLLTVEAMKLYFRHLKPEGVLAIHISNAQLNLEPVVAKLRLALNKEAVLISSEKNEGLKINSSDWTLITSNKNLLEIPEIKKVSRSLEIRPELRLWTDDYNNLFQILK